MDDPLDRYALTFPGRSAPDVTFLLGSRGGFVLYLPGARNERDRTLYATKWLGASGFGRTFLDGILVWAGSGDALVALNRANQTSFVAHLDHAERTYRAGDTEIRETLFVPDGLQAVVLTLEGDAPFVVKPELDLRYYQSFNTDFSHYGAEETDGGVLVCNRVESVGSTGETMSFFGFAGVLGGADRIEMLPPDERLVEKAYLRDEHRHKLVASAYAEAQSKGPDEAPIWDQYETKVFAPACFHAHGPLTFLCAFGDAKREVLDAFETLRRRLPELRREKRETIAVQLEAGRMETGDEGVDTAYAHVLTRFGDCLVARDATLHVDPVHQEHFYGIFAGDKYFMDAWKRDENISLEALLVTNDYETARHILDNTWQDQDERTGRLPHIIRAGEPLVYYSSDGTLWALQRLHEYTRMSGDHSLLEEKLPMVRHFFAASMSFVRRGLLPSGGIIDRTYLWETWEDTPYTPRAGYPVEIELLWLSALEAFLPAIRPVDASLAGWMEGTLVEGKETFEEFIVDGSYLADSLSYEWKPDPALTPNGYIAFGLGYPLPPELMRPMVVLAREQLAGQRGVRSLAPRDWPRVFPHAFLEDPRYVRGKEMASVGIFNYHRGIEWEWLNPFFVAGELTCGTADEAYARYVHGQVNEAVHDMGIGGLSELWAMQGQVGADFQAWSMAGFLESLHLFAGVRVDALERTVRVRPALPPALPRLAVRRRVGETRFDVRYAEPSASERRLEIGLLDPAPEGYTLHLAFRVPAAAQVRARLNGEPLPPDRLTQEPGCPPDQYRTVGTSCAFRDALIELEIDR